MAKIETTGQLRAFLVKMIIDVEGDKSNTNQVCDVVSLATKVNDSLACEARIMEVQNSLKTKVSKLGELPITGK